MEPEDELDLTSPPPLTKPIAIPGSKTLNPLLKHTAPVRATAPLSSVEVNNLSEVDLFKKYSDEDISLLDTLYELGIPIYGIGPKLDLTAPAPSPYLTMPFEDSEEESMPQVSDKKIAAINQIRKLVEEATNVESTDNEALKEEINQIILKTGLKVCDVGAYSTKFHIFSLRPLMFDVILGSLDNGVGMLQLDNNTKVIVPEGGYIQEGLTVLAGSGSMFINYSDHDVLCMPFK